MRRAFSFLPLILAVPLAACFDADLTVDFPDQNNAVATMAMTATPEFYAMATSGDEPFCKGEESLDEDGNHVCTEIVTGTIDEVINDPDIGEGMTIERRDGGLIYVAFDLGALTDDIGPPADEEGAEEMADMMRAAFEGHAITLNVSGAEVLETNGTVSEDGTMATFVIPLAITIDGMADMPDTFNALIQPGG